MEVKKTFRFDVRTFQAGAIAGAFATTLERLGIDASAGQYSIHEKLADGTDVHRRSGLDELTTVCGQAGQSVSHTSIGLESGEVHFSLSCYADSCLLYVAVGSPAALETVRRSFVDALALEESRDAEEEQTAETKQFQALESVTRRIDALEEVVLNPRRRLRCFLSYRFTDTNEIVALRVSQFLRLLGVEVLSGASYEPRRITEKVLSKLNQPLDFIVLLVTTNGESLWTRDEVGAAVHHGIALVPLVEEGATFEPGLFGDIEYVRFASGHIGDSFLKLLEAVSFIREQQGTQTSTAAHPRLPADAVG
jgi:hypothetical protein